MSGYRAPKQNFISDPHIDNMGLFNRRSYKNYMLYKNYSPSNAPIGTWIERQLQEDHAKGYGQSTYVQNPHRSTRMSPLAVFYYGEETPLYFGTATPAGFIKRKGSDKVIIT